MRYLFIYIILFSLQFPVVAQQVNQNKAQLASSYYRNKEYEKAAQLYIELYDETNMSHYFDYYINSLVFVKDYDNAIKTLKKQLRRNKNSNLEITLGYVYKEMGDIAKANETYDDVIKSLQPSKGVIISIGNNFFNRREYDYAEKTYLKGREILQGEMFYSNLASVYAYLRDYKRMMTEYMALIKEDDKSVPIVQSRLSSLLRYDFDNSLKETIKRQVISNIQAAPDVIAFNRLLIWLFTIEENYEQALLNAIALDRRTKTEESNIISFAQSATDKQLYDVALQGLNYLRTRKTPLESRSLVITGITNIEFLKYVNTPPKQRQPNDVLINSFESTLNEIGYSAETAKLAQTYAHFLAFYLSKPDAANEVLNKALQIRNLNNFQRSDLRIEQADINVYNNNLWDAAFQYSQIIEANRENSLGDAVQLKKAKLSFYLGDVQWARIQLDALKASTSKLIANDAMELSLLISANYDLDTIEKPLQLFAKGDLYLFQNKDSLAFVTFDSITTLYPNHSLSDKILMRKAQINEMRFDFETTAAIYETLLKNYAYSTSADDAMYKLALLYETRLNNKEKAQELYKQIMLDYPGSIFVSDSRNRYRILRGDYSGNQEVTPYESQEYVPN